MEFVGLAFTVTSAASRVSTGIWGLTREWRYAPRELHSLREDIIRVERFFAETGRATETASERLRVQSKPAQRQVDQLQTLLENGRELLVELESIVQQIRGPRRSATDDEISHELGNKRRIIWLAKKERVGMIQRRIQDITLETCGMLIALNMSVSTEYYHSIASSYRHIVTHLDSKLSSLQNQIASIGTTAQEHQPLNAQYNDWNPRTPGEEELETTRMTRQPGRQFEQFWATTAAHATGAKGTASSSSALAYTNPWASFISSTSRHCRVGPNCDFDCNCRCHSTRSYTAWEMKYLSSFAGMVVLSYFGSPRWKNSCDKANCMNQTNQPRSVRLTYTLPAWLTNATIFLSYGNLTGRPELIIRISNTVPSSLLNVSNDLYTQVCQGHTEGVKSLLRTRNCSVYDTIESCQLTVLYFAIAFERPDIVEILLQAGSDPFQVNALGQSPIRKAFALYISRPSDAAMARYATLFNFEALLDEDELSHLQRVILGFMVGDVKELLAKPSVAGEINHRDVTQNTALHLAATQGNVDTIRLLLRAGADMDAKNGSGKTPLHEACLAGNYDAVEVLLEAGASVRVCDSAKRTPLHLAAQKRGTARIMRLLIRFGVDIGALNTAGCTAASKTAAYADIESLELLLGEGIDINHRDLEGETVLFDAVSNGRHDSVAVLLQQQGILLTNINEYGRSVLHVLAGCGDLDMIRLFARANLTGLDTKAKDMEDRTPLQIFNGRLRVDKELQEAFDYLLDAVEAAPRTVQFQWEHEAAPPEYSFEDPDGDDEVWFDCIDNDKKIYHER